MPEPSGTTGKPTKRTDTAGAVPDAFYEVGYTAGAFLWLLTYEIAVPLLQATDKDLLRYATKQWAEYCRRKVENLPPPNMPNIDEVWE